jgi:hypothetical protein
MQLKMKRSQRTGGMMGGTAIFCLDARADLTREEQDSVARYKIGSQVIYNSEASRQALERGSKSIDGSALGTVKGLAFAALSQMRLNITINSLQQGQHIECKSLDELLGAEQALMTACRNLQSYLVAANSFDGREVVVNFVDGVAENVAEATAPQPILAITPPPIAASASSAIAADRPMHREEEPLQNGFAYSPAARRPKPQVVEPAYVKIAIGLVVLAVVLYLLVKLSQPGT